MRILPFLMALTAARAADWPQFLGPGRDGHAPDDTPLIASLPDDGYHILWKHECGAGFAGPVVSGGRVILFHRTADQNVVEAVDATSGKVIWKSAWPTDYRDDFGFDEGPRSSPTIDHDEIFCYGADGTLTALHLSDGRTLWRADLTKSLESEKGFFGRCSAPLVTGDAVLLAAGGKDAGVAAFDRHTGALKWKSLSVEAGYASAILMNPPRGPRAVFFTREGVSGIIPETGKAAFSVRFRSSMHASVNAASPVAIDATRVFTSACYDTGAAVWKIGADDSLTPQWKATGKLDCHYSTPVLVDGRLYGFHGRQETGQELRCISAESGEVAWSVKMDAGHVIACGSRLIILTQNGELILTTASPDKTPDLSVRGEILRGGHRAPPALASGLLFAKDKSRMVCVDLRRNPAK